MTPLVMDKKKVISINEDPTLELIRRYLPSNYFNLKPFKEGGTKKIIKDKMTNLNQLGNI